ncbi:MAG: sugar MFS transporter [Bacteroidales bacterium]|nr:sugar MFS transporter [Bacteroidales bacterium]
MKDKTRSQFILSMVMLGCLYFVFGLVSWVNSILVPYFKVACELHSEVQSYLAQFAFYIAYLVMTIPASALLNRVGYKKGALIGLWILALGAFLFTPAALTRTYNMFLVALFTMGTALAILQTVANPFVTIIGPMESAAKRISIVGICNKFAGILAPLIFSAIVIKPNQAKFDLIQSGSLEGAAKDAALSDLLHGVIPPYIVLGALLLVFGVVFYRSSIKDINPSRTSVAADAVQQGRKSVLSYPYLVLGVLALFCHLGTQALSINTIIPFAGEIGVKATEIFPSLTLACTLLGYFLGVILIPKHLSQQQTLKICTTMGCVFSVLVIVLPPQVGIWFLVLMGIPNSVIYAGIWPLAIHDLGKWTNLGSAILVMALCGSAIFPLVKAAIVDSTGCTLQMSYWILIPAFLYMMFYAFFGHKINNWKN